MAALPARLVVTCYAQSIRYWLQDLYFYMFILSLSALFGFLIWCGAHQVYHIQYSIINFWSIPFYTLLETIFLVAHTK